MDNQFRKELESIEIPKELNDRVIEGFMQAEKEMHSASSKKQIKKINKKILIWVAAAVMFVGLFIGSTFISPVMAKIASRIPMFNTILNRGPIGDALIEYLMEQGFSITGASQINDSKEMSILIDHKQYSTQKDEVKKVAEQYLYDEGYSNLNIKVKKSSGEETIIKNAKEYPLENTDFIIEITKKMEKAGFDTKYNSIGTKPKPAELTLVIPESDYKTRKSEIIKIVKETGEIFGVGDFKISFKTFTFEERDRNARWENIISSLNELLLIKEEYSVKSFGSSVEDIVSLYVVLDIPSNNTNAKETAKTVEHDIQQFLSSQDIKKTIQGDRYKIEISSKDNKKLN